MSIPDEFRHLFEQDVIASFTTLEPDGTPHVTPVWTDYHDGDLLINSQEGRRKVENARRNPSVAVMAVDPDDAYRYISVQGSVSEITEEGAVEHYKKLAEGYTGDASRYEKKHAEKDQPRVIVRIVPEKNITWSID